MGLLGKGMDISHVSLTGVLRVPTVILGSLLQQFHTGSLMGRGCLLRDHQTLLILSDAPSPPGVAVKASQQREGFPQGSSDSRSTNSKGTLL